MRLITLAPALLLLSCGAPSTTETAEGSMAGSATAVAAGPERQNVCLWNELGVRDTPSDKGKYLTSIYLGEHVVMTGDSATETVGSKTSLFYKVTLSDGKSGWVRSDFMGKGGLPAAVVQETSLYKRPDLATVTDVRLGLVEYLVAWPTGNGWAKVKTKITGDKWFVEGYVQEKSLLYDKAEVDFAVLAKRFNETDKPAIKQALNDQLSDPAFANTRMYSIYYEGSGDGEGEYTEEHVMETDQDIDNGEIIVEDLPDLNTAHGRIINVFGEDKYWYVWSLKRYRLQETSAEAIRAAGIDFYHCTEEQLEALPVGEYVFDYIPQPNTPVK